MTNEEIVVVLSSATREKIQRAADHVDMTLDEFVLFAALQTANRINDEYRFGSM